MYFYYTYNKNSELWSFYQQKPLLNYSKKSRRMENPLDIPRFIPRVLHPTQSDSRLEQPL